MMYVLLTDKLDLLEMSGLFETAKSRGMPPRTVEMEPEDRVLIGAKTGPQRSCYLKTQNR